MSNLAEKVDEIPGEDGWWKSGSQKDYQRLATRGLGEDEAADILFIAYWSAAECFGGC